MKKIIITLLTLILAVSLFAFTGCNKKETLTVYTNSGFPPFEYTQGTDVVGVDMDIAKAIADELGMELDIKDVTFESVIAGISGDNTIGLAGLSITPDRAAVVDFSIPYYNTIQYVIYPSTGAGTLTVNVDNKVDGSQLAGKDLGVQTSTTGDTLATDESVSGGLFEGATVKQYDDALVATDAIGSGCDYVIIDHLTAVQIVANSTGFSCSEIQGLTIEYYAVAVKKGNTELLATVNAVIQKLLDDGTIEQWLEDHAASV